MIRIRVGGPLEPYRAGIEGELDRLGYSQGRSTMLMLLVAHVSAWMDERHLAPSALTDEAVDEFFAVRSPRTWCRSPQSFAPALAYLRAVGAAPAMSTSGLAPRHPRWCFGSRSAGGAWTSEG
jgi:integrase/recombinase XerD